MVAIEQTAATLQKAIKAREVLLAPLFTQIAHAFADLHDTPGRMLAKGCISRVVPWKSARRELFYRLRRRLYEAAFGRRLSQMVTGVTAVQVCTTWCCRFRRASRCACSTHEGRVATFCFEKHV